MTISVSLGLRGMARMSCEAQSVVQHLSERAAMQLTAPPSCFLCCSSLCAGVVRLQSGTYATTFYSSNSCTFIPLLSLLIPPVIMKTSVGACFSTYFALYLLGTSTIDLYALECSQAADAFPSPSADEDFCASLRTPPCRTHAMSIVEFGAVGDGVTTNTQAFQNAINHLSVFADQGGAQLHVPAGIWLTGSFNLTSHFTLFLEKDAVILGSQDPKEWPVIDALPSYGRGRELPGGRHMSLIHGENLTDVVITGENGTVDGQGEIWWNMHANGKLDYTRGHLVELMHSQDIIIANLTFKNSPFWTIHPVYSSNVLISNLTILAPIESSNTDGVDPDSSTCVCIEDCYIQNGDDLIAIKSGWDEYGIAYGRPSSRIRIRRIVGETRSSAGIAMGSEMSGGISDVYVDDLIVHHAGTGIRVKSAQGRGGYVRDIYISNVLLHNVRTGIAFNAFYGDHPDRNYNRTALPCVERVLIQNAAGYNITLAGDFEGLADAPFQNIVLANVTFNVTSVRNKWRCANVRGYASLVSPVPCLQLSTGLKS